MITSTKVAKVNIRVLQFAAQSWGATYCDVISDIDSNNILEQIITRINSDFKYDMVWLNHIPSFTSNFDDKDLLPYQACPEINLKAFDSYLGYKQTRYSKGLKQNIRTAYNRAKKN